MPTYRDVVVEVTDVENKALTEYGVRKRDRARLTTCYIQSKTDMAFRIRIKPVVHLMPQMVDSDKSDDGPSEGRSSPQGGKLKMHLLSFADEIDACKRTRRVRDRPQSSREKPSSPPPTEPREAPW